MINKRQDSRKIKWISYPTWHSVRDWAWRRLSRPMYNCNGKSTRISGKGGIGMLERVFISNSSVIRFMALTDKGTRSSVI
jgi:hypothetical protein